VTDEGPTRVDLHVKVLDADVVARAKERGLDAIVYAPHFVRLPEIRERAARFEDDELLVVPGREVFTGTWRHRRHVLGVGLTEPVPDFITLEAAFGAFERQGAATLVPHPTYLNVGLQKSEVREHRERIDALETTNPKHFPWHDRRNRRLASELDLPPFGSSYAHLKRTVGAAWTEFDRAIDSADDLVRALHEGWSRRAVRASGMAYQRHRLAEWGHLAYENTYEKADRLLWRGTEPTHPDHIAYGGRFDDDCVY
jgi:predicted metal-dependent phosphoesterase TrpH